MRHALPVCVEGPAVIGALQASVVEAPAGMQRGAAVRAAIAEQPHRIAVAVGHEVLVHDGEAVQPLPDRARERNGLPEGAQISPCRRAGAGGNQLLLLVQIHHDLSSAGRRGMCGMRCGEKRHAGPNMPSDAAKVNSRTIF